MFLLINKTQAKCCSTHATSGTPYTGKVHTAGDVTLKQSDKPLLWKGREGDDTCDAVESWILQTNIPQTNALLPCIVRWSKVGSSPYSRNYFFGQNTNERLIVGSKFQAFTQETERQKDITVYYYCLIKHNSNESEENDQQRPTPYKFSFHIPLVTIGEQWY